MYKLILTFCIWSCCICCKAQHTEKDDMLKMLGPTLQDKPKWQVAKNNHNLGQKLFSALFLVYKKVISSQDYNHCSFEPSCSEYAIRSLKKYGVFVAFLDTADRLLRCNGMSPENYEMNPETELLVDYP